MSDGPGFVRRRKNEALYSLLVEERARCSDPVIATPAMIDLLRIIHPTAASADMRPGYPFVVVACR